MDLLQANASDGEKVSHHLLHSEQECMLIFNFHLYHYCAKCNM